MKNLNQQSDHPAPRPRKRARSGQSSEHESSDNDDYREETLTTQLPMINQVDWRAVICQFLGVTPQTDDNTIQKSLREAAINLEAANSSTSAGSRSGATNDMSYQVIHRVRCEANGSEELSLGVPWLVRDPDGLMHLRGTEVIDHLELHLERNKWVAFIAYETYACCRETDSLHKAVSQLIRTESASDLHVESSFVIVSQEFGQTLNQLWSDAVDCESRNEFDLQFDLWAEFKAPYTWLYHHRKDLHNLGLGLGRERSQYSKIFEKYIEDKLEDEYREVDNLLADVRIQAKYLPYIYLPGEIQLSKTDGQEPQYYRAFKATSFLMNDISEYTSQEAQVKFSKNSKWFIEGSQWVYDGAFWRQDVKRFIDCKFPWEDSFPIQELAVYPLHFAGPEVTAALQRRGNLLWECRLPKYVYYHDDVFLGAQTSPEARYMIDMKTYNDMHKREHESAMFKLEELCPDETKPGRACPQARDFVLCLPATMPGFHMHKKEWITLYMSRVSSVSWNTEAFNFLVIDEAKKKLIKAVITNSLMVRENTDLIGGKGNGLFILLHGGPGTGKTLTAESVAEIAQKPLYRVTCGDVGTKAEEVEDYLQTVLLLGTTWGCVVLLDEADVFLMQRSVENFERNALVSVFLRVLEYYDGILILTSNRVGTFDAAFKSRIQLSIHYPRLGERERLQIWTNFIGRIESMEGPGRLTRSVGIQEIERKLPELAKEELNGREIRNAISTARQLAMYETEPLGYKHLKTVVAEMKAFDDYAIKLQQNFTDDELARDRGEY